MRTLIFLTKLTSRYFILSYLSDRAYFRLTGKTLQKQSVIKNLRMELRACSVSGINTDLLSKIELFLNPLWRWFFSYFPKMVQNAKFMKKSFTFYRCIGFVSFAVRKNPVNDMKGEGFVLSHSPRLQSVLV